MRVTGVLLVAMHLLSVFVCTATATDWDAWYDGNVDVQLRVQGGDGAVLLLGSEVALEFEASESAYHMVVGIDHQGAVQLLFPRFWEDDGWVRRGSIQQVRSVDFAAGRRPSWGAGIVHVEVIASPVPFDFKRIGLRRSEDGCRWIRGGRPLQAVGDPYEAFNDLHRRLFPRWDHALFSVDYTWFFMRDAAVGSRCDVPAYGSVTTRPVVLSQPHVIRARQPRLRWEWQFGAWCARPVYRSVNKRSVSHVQRTSYRMQPVPRQVRVETDPRVQRKLVTPVRQRNASRRADERVVIRQQVESKKSEAYRRKL